MASAATTKFGKVCMRMGLCRNVVAGMMIPVPGGADVDQILRFVLFGR